MSNTWVHPVLGQFNFNEEYDWWEGQATLPAFKMFGDQESNVSYEVCINGEEGLPTQDAVKLLDRVIANQTEIVKEVVEALIADFLGEGPDSGMWWRGNWAEIADELEIDDVPSFENVSPLLSFSSIWVDYREIDQKVPYVELRFGADFESEHGVGVLTDGESILGLGHEVDVEEFPEPREKTKSKPSKKEIVKARETVAEVIKIKKNVSALPGSMEKLKKVKSLNLSGKKLTSLPEELFELTQLEELNLSNNQIESLSERLGQLSNLKYLDLTTNRLKKLPESIGQLTRLENLNANGNQLEHLPESIRLLKNLKHLCISANRLKELPSCLSELRNLISLYAEQNQLTELPASVGELHRLDRLLLSENQLTSLPESMMQLNLRKLMLLDNHETLGVPEEVLGLGMFIPKECLKSYFDLKSKK